MSKELVRKEFIEPDELTEEVADAIIMSRKVTIADYDSAISLAKAIIPIIQKAARAKAFEDIQKTVSGKCWEEIDRLMHKGEG